MTTAHDSVVPNHHAGRDPFSGPMGLVAALSLVTGRGPVSRLAVETAAVTDRDHVVDVGCGPGAAVRQAAAHGARVTGVDPASIMRTVARFLTRDSSRIAWADGTAEALPLPDQSATVLWSVATVHHWVDVPQGLAEAHRVLEPDGRLVAIETRVGPGARGHGSHGWTPEQAEAFGRFCETAGFTDVSVDHATPGGKSVLVVRAARNNSR
jgi:ubiquinone/menaquinone biosynthesis C-methylase UbiE